MKTEIEINDELSKVMDTVTAKTGWSRDHLIERAVAYYLARNHTDAIDEHWARIGWGALGDRFEAFRGHAGPGMSTDELMALTRGDDEAPDPELRPEADAREPSDRQQ